MHRTSRSGHTPRLKYHVPSPQHAATNQSDLTVLNFSSWKVTFPQFPSFNRSLRARRINATRESLFKNWPDVTTRPPFFCDQKRRNNATPLYIQRSSILNSLKSRRSTTSILQCFLLMPLRCTDVSILLSSIVNLVSLLFVFSDCFFCIPVLLTCSSCFCHLSLCVRV